jgi:hypothetical protein
MELITRADARERGLKRYFTGEPCKHGHLTERFCVNGYCCECTKVRFYESRRQDPQRFKVKNSEYHRNNKAKVNARHLARRTEKRCAYPLEAEKERVRCLIKQSIRLKGFTKRTRTAEILGCDWGFFKRHIEKQFLPGMTWENRELWHIDHITPMSAAESEADVHALNHFTNLRPLWKPDNLAKRDKVLFLL